MSRTDAERARRYRRHKAGDHSLCVEGRCAALNGDRPTETRTEPSGPLGPDGLDAAGRRLWDEMTSDGEVAPMQAVLLLQACRIVDRLDRLDRQLRGEDWLRFRHEETGDEVRVYVDRVLAEEREQAVALKTLFAELRQALGKQKQPQQRQKGGGVLGDLAARRAARSVHTAG